MNQHVPPPRMEGATEVEPISHDAKLAKEYERRIAAQKAGAEDPLKS